MAVEAPPKVAEVIAGELKPSRARRVDKSRSWALGIWSALALLYLFIPIFVIVVFSFNDPVRAVQLHLAGLHARPLAASVHEPGSGHGDEELVPDRADLDR